MKPRMRVIERVRNIMLHTRTLNGMLMFPTLMSKTELLRTLCNMNYHANFLYNAIGIRAEDARFTTSTGNLIDKLMEENDITFKTIFSMIREIISNDLLTDPCYKPQANGEPWFINDCISNFIQLKNEFKQVDRNKIGCLDANPTAQPEIQTATLERLPTQQESEQEIHRNIASGTAEMESNIRDYEIDERNEQEPLDTSQQFLDYCEKASISSLESQINDEDHGDLYEGFPPEFM